MAAARLAGTGCILAVMLVAGCQQTGGLLGGSDEVNPITGGEIAATTLDAPADAATDSAPEADPDAAPGPTDAALAQAAAPATIQPPSSRQTRLVDRDVEAPEVFDMRATALWDGRPSLGGVWVASADAVDPERVIMRNPANGQFVIGALFRRERDNPGPPLQISSDAAEALGILAGAPAEISVTALRREEAQAAAPAPAAPVLDRPEVVAGELPVPEPEPEPEPQPAAPAAPAAPTAIAADTRAALEEPAPAGGDIRVQVGIFSERGNADRAVVRLQQAGIAAQVRQEQSSGKTFWSVVANGPAPRAAFVDKVRAAGFADAYPLSG